MVESSVLIAVDQPLFSHDVLSKAPKPLAATLSETCFMLFTTNAKLPVKVDNMCDTQVQTRGGGEKKRSEYFTSEASLRRSTHPESMDLIHVGSACF